MSFLIMGSFATTSPTGGVCRLDEDCQTARQTGETLYCKGASVLWTYNLDAENLPSEFIPQTGCNLILQRRSPTDQVTTHKQLENMMVFPYCVGDSGQPQPSQDKAKFEWVTHRLGAEDESFFILDGLKEAKEGMVYGTRLRAFNPVNDKEKQHEVIDIAIDSLDQALFPHPTYKGVGDVKAPSPNSQDLHKGFLYEGRTCQRERYGKPAYQGSTVIA